MSSTWRRLVAGALTGVPALVVAQQATTVSGVVTSEANQPITGASVSITSLGLGAVTNAEGRYSFNVPANRATGTVTLSVRRLGFAPKTQTITLGAGPVSADFQLAPTPSQLEGIVVTALGQTREKSTLGTAQQQISTEELTTTKAQNLVSQLQGKVSGVQITSAGTPGGTTNIIIRGQNSLAGNNQPLFIVDGVPVSNSTRGGTLSNGYDYGNAISDLNPDDIASLTVLKGPNAAALYGSRAANGVIVITTKKGSATQGRIRAEFNSFVTADRPSILPDWQNSYGQGAGGSFKFVDGQGSGDCDGCDQSWGPKLDGRLIDQFTGKQQPWVAHPDNVNNFFDTGVTLSSTLAVSGGTDRANARVSVGADQIKGFVPNNTFRKRSVLLSGNLGVNSKLNTTATVQYIRNGGVNRPGTGYSNSILEQFFWLGRQVDTDALRNYAQGGGANGGPLTREYNWNYNYHNNPFWVQNENPRKDNRDRFQGTLSATYQLAEGVSLLARTGSDIFRFNVDQNYAPGYINSTYVNTSYNGGFVSIDDYNNENNSEALLTVDRPLTGALRLNATVGGNLRNSVFQTKSQALTGLLVAGLYNISNGAIDPALTQQTLRRKVNSGYGSAALSYNGWLTVEGTARNDWSSTLPRGENSYFYPSGNVALVLTDAVPALKNSVLSYAKLRGSVAQVGNDADPYQLVTVFRGNSVKFGTLPQYSLGDTLANATLKPEITHSDEGGLELGLFDGRVTLDGSVYNKYTKNQIFAVAVSSASGFANRAINAGKITNKGAEALLTVEAVRGWHGLGWTSAFNYAQNRNAVAELTQGVNSIVLSQGLFADISVEARVGEPFGVIRTKAFERDAQGRLIVEDGLPIQQDTLTAFGNVQAKWTGGWNNTFTWKGLTLNALVDFRQGGKIVSYTNSVGEYSGVLKSSLLGREVDFDNPKVLVQGVNADGTANTTRVKSEEYFQSLFGSLEPYIYDASYTRLRELRVGFDLPTRITRRLSAENVSLTLTGRNLFFFSKKAPNIDPEFAYNTGNFQGVEYAFPSNPRSIGINVRVTP